MSNRCLRRAAILIASLDTDSADALLDEMSARRGSVVRNAVMELGDIDIVEQQEVIEQFVGPQPSEPGPPVDGVELDPELAKRLADTDATISRDRPATSNEAHAEPANHSPRHAPSRA